MEKGSVVVIGFPQSDGSYKSRPAILLKEVAPYNDWLLCIVSNAQMRVPTHLNYRENHIC